MDLLQRLAGDPLGAAVLLFAVTSWIYVLACLRAIRNDLADLAAELRTARSDVNEKTTLEQRGEILRRAGWAVSYLEEIDRKLSQATRDLNVASITAENLVVKPQPGSRREEPSREPGGTTRLSR